MKNVFVIAALLSCAAMPGFGSIIFPFSNDPTTTTQVTLGSFDAFGNTMGPMIISDDLGASCAWDTSIGGCDTADFQIRFNPATDRTFPPAAPGGFWSIENIGDDNILTITIDALKGNVALDRCMSAPATFNDNGNNFLFSDCSFEGTPGSNLGWTANNAPGGFGVFASVEYSNLLYTGALPASAVGDLYGVAKFTFGSSFDSGDTFTWRMDTDLLEGAPAAEGVPEAGTLSLVGGALLALGALRRRKRN